MTSPGQMRPKCSRWVLVALVWAAAAIVPPSACHAYVWSVEISPEEPTESDSVSVDVRASFGDLCWYMDNHVCPDDGRDTLEIHLYFIDEWQPGWVCLQMPYGVRLQCDFGLLARGEYTVTVYEHRESFRHPGVDTVSVMFEIRPSAPVEHWTWGRIRALYGSRGWAAN